MSESWDPFMLPDDPRLKPLQDAARRHQAETQGNALTLTRTVFGTQAGQAWLAMMAQHELARPSYRPGDAFDHVAYREGRKALLREIAATLTAQDQTA